MTQVKLPANTKLWNLVGAAILAISVLKGIRYPSAWAYTHYLFNYNFGFTKRALIGTLINLLGIPYLKSYSFFLIFSTVMLFANIFLIYLFMRDLIASNNKLLVGCAIIFASSLGVVYLANSNGYFEQIGLLAVLIAMRVKGFFRKLLFLIPSFAIALLAHEANFIIFFPVIFISLLLDIKPENGLKKLIALGIFSAVTIMLVFFIGNSTISRGMANKMYRETTTEIKDISLINTNTYEVLISGVDKSLVLMQKHWTNKDFPQNTLNYLLATLPAILTLIYLMVMMLKKSNASKLLIILSILASVSPFVLNFLASDMNRWNTLAITTSFLVLSTVFTSNKSAAADLPEGIYPILIFVLFLNATTTIYMFGGYTVRQFPFLEHQNFILGVIRGEIAFP
jgi:hypothetical protein